MNDEERAEQGMAVRRAVLGDAHVDRAAANTTEFSAPFQDWITRYAWGEIWSRPGLSRPQRSIVTLTVLAALQHEDELAMHTKAALRNGLTEDEIREVLLQVGLYAGVPVANRAFAIANRAINEYQAEQARSRPERGRRLVLGPSRAAAVWGRHQTVVRHANICTLGGVGGRGGYIVGLTWLKELDHRDSVRTGTHRPATPASWPCPST